MADPRAVSEANVLCWEGRPKRARRQAPKTYWEEYVETDQWYSKKLVEDVPADEMHAALYDDNLDNDSGEEDEEGGGDEEVDGESTDEDYEEEGVTNDEVSEASYSDADYDSGEEGDFLDDDSTTASEGAQVQRPAEGE